MNQAVLNLLLLACALVPACHAKRDLFAFDLEHEARMRIASIQLASSPEELAAEQQTSMYEAVNGIVVRRCSQFKLQVSHEPGGMVLVETPAHKQGVHKHVLPPAGGSPTRAEATHRFGLSSPGRAVALLAKANASSVKPSTPGWDDITPETIDATCQVDSPSASTCELRLGTLEALRKSVDEKCGLPLQVPSEVVGWHAFCASSQAECNTYKAELRRCLVERRPLDIEIAACEGCLNTYRAGNGGSMLEAKALTAEEVTKMAEVELVKEAAWQRQVEEKRRVAEEFFKAAEAELHHGSSHAGADEASAVLARPSVQGTWPSELSFGFWAENDEGRAFAEAGVWSAARLGECAAEAKDCTYVVTIPCNAALGPGSLRDGWSGAALPKNLYVVFNPFDEQDETYMSPATFSKEELHTYLTQTKAGIWRGSSTSNEPMQWMVDQFHSSVVEAVMKMVAMIPVAQRGSAVRVTRWLTYLLNNKVLHGNWCSEPGCMDDGVKPWEWHRSRDIYGLWLESGEMVKYGQCWVFAALLNSACRALGAGTRVVTNFNSAHGRPPYNKGIDDFFFYNDKLQPVVDHVNKQESIWNFHVWNDVWMARGDLPDEDADGWQAIDATPQEESCEMREGNKVCRYMMGPASLKVIRDRRMETEGGETAFESVGAGMSYDSMFVFGEVDGDWRGWKPLSLEWGACPATCKEGWRGDGYCDDECNIPECDFDVGDCCEESCTGLVDSVRIYRKYTCGSNGYECRGEAKGWTLRYKNTDHIGTQISTQSPGRSWRQLLDLTLVAYKRSQ